MIFGGDGNKAAGNFGQVYGGRSNEVTASGNYAAIFSGNNNFNNGSWSNIFGSVSSTVTSAAYNSTIVGGNNSNMSGSYSTIVGGYPIAWPTSNSILSNGDTIVGGAANTINSYGNMGNKLGLSGIFVGYNNRIGGGGSNNANHYNAIIGGQNNRLYGGQAAVIIGGADNEINSGGNGDKSKQVAIIGSGASRIISGGTEISRATILSCLDCEISPIDTLWAATAIGYRAKVKHPSSIVMAGADYGMAFGPSPQDFVSTASNQFNARFANGFRFCTNDTTNNSTDLGCFTLSAGGAGLVVDSDKNLKTAIKEVDEAQEDLILEKIAELPLAFWKYKASKKSPLRNLGPMAQDFHRLFSKPLQLQSGEKRLSSSDLSGIQLVAVKGLNRKISSLEKENQKLTSEIEMLKADMAEMKKLMRTK